MRRAFSARDEAGRDLSLEFTVDHPCGLRARYAEEHLRAWGRLASIHTRLTTGEASAPTEEKLRFVERAGEEIERMQSETAVCETCPAYLSHEAEGEPVGCQGRVNYPIEAQFEKFIADRVQLALDTVDGKTSRASARHRCRDSPLTAGARVFAQHHHSKPPLYELRLPIRLTRERRTSDR